MNQSIAIISSSAITGSFAFGKAGCFVTSFLLAISILFPQHTSRVDFDRSDLMSGNGGYNKPPSLFGFPSSMTAQQTPSNTSSVDGGTETRPHSLAPASLKAVPNAGRSMFGSIFNSDSQPSPRTQPNTSHAGHGGHTGTTYDKLILEIIITYQTSILRLCSISMSSSGGAGGRDNLRSLIITFNHSHKTDDVRQITMRLSVNL